MALPASGPISQSQVATEFSVSLTNISLSNLGTQLSTPITAGQPVELANDFYGQSGVTLTAFGYSGTEPFEDASTACSEGGSSGTAYHDGSGTFPVADDFVYQDSAGSTPLDDGFYRMNSGQSLEVEDEQAMTIANCGRSDRRLKHNIVFRTYSKSGIPVYEFEYVNKSDGKGKYVGTMAQDLLKLGKSEAVITDKEGYYLVDYNKVDVDFYEI
jgi:hypothetical protein